MKKTTLALGLSLVCYGGAALAVGEPTNDVTIDFDGAGGLNGNVQVGSLDWAVGQSLADGGALASQAGDSFQIYTHASLQGYQLPNGNTGPSINGLNSAFEWTFIFGATEKLLVDPSIFTLVNGGAGANGGGDDVYEIRSSVQFTADTQTTADGFFWRMYYDTNVNADALSGQGFDDGQLILSADSLDFLGGAFASTLFSFTDLNDNGVYDPGEENAYSKLDSFGADDWSDANNTYLSVSGRGGTDVEMSIGTQDFAFIKDALSTILSNIVFSTENIDPFLQTNPSMCFDSDGTTVLDTAATALCLAENDIVFSDASALFGPGAVLNGADLAALGFNNGVFTGEDIMFQTDANQAFRIEVVPEPTTLALLGFGMGFLGLRRRKTGKV